MSAFEDYCIVCDKLSQDGSAYCSNDCKLFDENNLTSPSLSVCSNMNLPSIHGSFSLHNSNSNVINNIDSLSSSNISTNQQIPINNSNSSNNVPTILSPLLTPQINSRCSVVSSIKSPNLKDLTYESPLLATSSSNSFLLNDLDSNRLDLNSSSSISERLSNSFKYNPHLHIPTINNKKPQVIQRNRSASLSITHHTKNNNPTTAAAVTTTTTNTTTTTKTTTPSPTTNDSKNTNTTITNISNILHSSSEKNYEKWLSIH